MIKSGIHKITDLIAEHLLAFIIIVATLIIIIGALIPENRDRFLAFLDYILN